MGSTRNLLVDFIAHEKISEKEFNSKLKQHQKNFPKEFFLPLMLDNHDTNRFLFDCGNDKSKLKKAIEFQCKNNQPIIIYSGDEIAIPQRKSIFESSDIEVRQPIDWNEIDEEILDFYRRKIGQIAKHS